MLFVGTVVAAVLGWAAALGDGLRVMGALVVLLAWAPVAVWLALRRR